MPVAVLSGNRNFPGRVHAACSTHAFLASPPLVVAFALAGERRSRHPERADRPGRTGGRCASRDLWPTEDGDRAALARGCRPDDFADAYADAEASAGLAALEAPDGAALSLGSRLRPICAARRSSRSRPSERRLGRYVAQPLIVLGDDITTDHISPAGAIPRQERGRPTT